MNLFHEVQNVVSWIVRNEKAYMSHQKRVRSDREDVVKPNSIMKDSRPKSRLSRRESRWCVSISIVHTNVGHLHKDIRHTRRPHKIFRILHQAQPHPPHDQSRNDGSRPSMPWHKFARHKRPMPLSAETRMVR